MLVFSFFNEVVHTLYIFRTSDLYQKLNIPKENTYAFGDGENDIEMFHLVGTSVAMGNADDEVKKHASTVTLTVDEDGIADFFEKEFNIK